MREEWGPWQEHDGCGCPVQMGTVVEVVVEDRFGYRMQAVATVGAKGGSWDWRNYPRYKRILRYRVKRPKGMELLREILEQVKAPEKV